MTAIEYTVGQVLVAAQEAYRSSAAGDDDEYVTRKSILFVKRCMRYDGADEETATVSADAVNEVAYAALDADCERVFFRTLGC